MPHTARIRNLTYQTEVFCAVQILKIQYGDEDPLTGQPKIKSQSTIFQQDKVPIGKIPVMVRSRFCHLSQLSKDEIVKNARECRYDQGGYFIINGQEKVLVAQERMAHNIVLVFHRKPPTKYSWSAEIRSANENQGRPPQQFCVKLSAKGKSSFKG